MIKTINKKINKKINKDFLKGMFFAGITQLIGFILVNILTKFSCGVDRLKCFLESILEISAYIFNIPAILGLQLEDLFGKVFSNSNIFKSGTHENIVIFIFILISILLFGFVGISLGKSYRLFKKIKNNKV